MAESWSHTEVELIVSDYFQMLTEEIAGKPYNKAQHRRALLPLLNNRNESSVEFKHQNISAVLARLGLPYIVGYKPAWNYQKLLEEVIISYLNQNQDIETTFQSFATTTPTLPESKIEFQSFEEAAPDRQPIVTEPSSIYRTPVKVNYIELEQSNRIIGASGEKLVMEYERWRLISQGKESLADQIEWVSQTQGDGLGFDILSRNTNGTDRFIEVKSTKLTKEAPIFFSKNEFDFSSANKANYFLYRIFNLKNDPKLFIKNGSFQDFCHYEPVKYKGYF
jgi:hypothetical protein